MRNDHIVPRRYRLATEWCDAHLTIVGVYLSDSDAGAWRSGSIDGQKWRVEMYIGLQHDIATHIENDRARNEVTIPYIIAVLDAGTQRPYAAIVVRCDSTYFAASATLRDCPEAFESTRLGQGAAVRFDSSSAIVNAEEYRWARDDLRMC